MPSSSGINISTTVIDQTNSATITQNAGINSTTAINNIQLINLPRQHWCTVTVKVTSVATPTNFATKTFNVAYK
jgi:ABC-type enterochelin transport system substrate-binding protein